MTVIRQARIDRGWSQARVIVELERAAARLQVQLPERASLRTALSRWENGHRRPDSLYRTLLATAFGVEPADLGLDDDGSDRLGLVVGTSWEACVAEAAALWDGDLNRRDVAVSPFTPAELAGPGLAALASRPMTPPAGRRVGRRVGEADVAIVRGIIDTFGTLDNRFGGGQVRDAAVRYLVGEVGPLLRTGRFDAKTGRHLAALAAQLCQLVGWMAYDIHRYGLGQRYLTQALGLAKAAGDDALAGEILAALSYHATYLGEAQCGVELAAAAGVLAERCGIAALRAEAHVLEAHAYARQGDARACALSLGRAERTLDGADRSSDPRWLGCFDEAYLSATFGECFRDLGDAANTIRLARRSLDMNTDYLRGYAFNLLLLAHGQALAGEVELAGLAAKEATALVSNLESARALRYLKRVRQALQPANGSPTIGDLDAALRPALEAG